MSQIQVNTEANEFLIPRVMIKMDITLVFRSKQDEARFSDACSHPELLNGIMDEYRRGLQQVTTRLEEGFERLINESHNTV